MEARREVGVICHDPKITKQMISVFDKDWEQSAPEIFQDSMSEDLRHSRAQSGEGGGPAD